ncbi:MULTISPECIES: hypothetical protein [Candidatus Ichthyocystis]|uniref:Uncharacterized protein n=1 Tax=Candidatus Ichthyocystis hellenicum TaxID=1561003 RepID=A0A0S4M4Q2_9BURK|nr:MULTISPECIES: hypothetical protein [Ichthyocystis]CUT17826.1 hypothetical protein Ark11_1007 [Candidatus Ichthyocystis hellenicum]
MCSYFSKTSSNISNVDDISDNSSNELRNSNEPMLPLDQSIGFSKKTDSSVDSLLRDLFPDLVEVNTKKVIGTGYDPEQVLEQPSTSYGGKQSIDIGYVESINQSSTSKEFCNTTTAIEPGTSYPNYKHLNQKTKSTIRGNRDKASHGQKSSYSALKRPYVKTEDKFNPEQKITVKELFDMEFVNDDQKNTRLESISTVEKKNTFQIYEKISMPEELRIVSPSHRISNIYYDRPVETIYEYAIKRIIIDDKESLRKVIVEEFKNKIEDKKFNLSHMDYTLTCSKIRKYVCGVVSPHINSIIHYADVFITPGMSITDVRDSCISNDTFFNKLRKCCKEISRDIDEMPLEEFLPIMQSNLSFGRGLILKTNISTIADKRKRRISQQLKNLIIDTLNNLPEKIVDVIKKFEIIDILSGMFVILHNVYVTKSLIMDIIETHDYVEKTMIENKSLQFNFALAKKKLKEALEKSIVLHEEKVFSLNKYTTELMLEHLLSDANSIYYKFNSKLFCYSQLWSFDNIRLIGVYRFAILTINVDTSYSRYIGKDSIKDYIVDIINAFMNKFEEEIKVEINPHEGMTMEEFEIAYISNERFFNRLRKHCITIINKLERSDKSIIYEVIGRNMRSKLSEKEENNLAKFLSQLLAYNISNIPEKISNSIRMLPRSHLVGEFFSLYHNVYVDNSSISKIRIFSESTQKEIASHTILSGHMDRFYNDSSKYTTVKNFIENRLGKLKKEIEKKIMIISNNKVSIAEEEIRNLILSKVKLELMIKLANNY